MISLPYELRKAFLLSIYIRETVSIIVSNLELIFILAALNSLQIRQRLIYPLIIGIAIAITVFFCSIPIKISIARTNSPLPQAALTLGGDVRREYYAARLAAKYPHLEVWISSGKAPSVSKSIFLEAGIDLNRLHIDAQAVDTVTNFTTTVEQFQKRGIKHLYIVTSDFHMKRAKAIAFLILGSKGIAYTPVFVHSSVAPPESNLRIIRDIVRSIAWIMTKRTGYRLGAYFSAN